MSNKKSSLESFLENYIKNKKLTNSADTIDEYRAKNYSDYVGDYSRALEKAYLEARKADADHGNHAERIFSSGLKGSGYAERQKDLSLGKYESRVSELLAKKGKTDEEVRLGYARYLEGYEKNQNALMKTVRNELTKNRIADRERAYEYALMSGLSESRAREVSLGMYSVLRDTLVRELLDRVITYRLDAAGAAELARQYGLDDADTDYIRKEAERLGGKSFRDDGTLDYLEKEANKVTSSFK